MQAIVTATANAVILPPKKQWRSLYSSEYTSDHLARQRSIDFIKAKDYGSLVGLPDQMQLHENNWIRLTETRQRWLFDCECLSVYGVPASELGSYTLSIMKQEWHNFMDDSTCFTNHAGSKTCHDYINNTNVDKVDMQWEPLILAGNKVDVIGEPIKLTNKFYFGVQAFWHYPIRVLNAYHLPTPQEFMQDHFICHIPTTIKPDGTHGIFPQFDGQAVYPLWSIDGVAWVWDRLIG